MNGRKGGAGGRMPPATGTAVGVALMAVCAMAQTLQLERTPAGTARLRWRSVPGERFQVHHTADLRQPFAALSEVLSATAPSNTWDDPAASQRPASFYRLDLLNDPARSNWWQHAHDAMRTGYAPAAPAHPWRWAWQWNGSDAQGRVVANKILLPRNVQPIVAEGRVFIAAGTNGLIALDAATGVELWRVQLGGALNSTPAYDPLSGRLFAVSADGRLHRIHPQTGATEQSIVIGPPSALPLPPAIDRGHLWATMGNRMISYDTWTRTIRWTYVAPAAFETPPAYSRRHELVIACDSQLYVTAVSDRDGTTRWRTRASAHTPEPGVTTYATGWPVIAEDHELVLLRLRIAWDYLWRDIFEVPDNNVIRQRLDATPLARCHFALRLADGERAFDINNGLGGFGDGGYMPLGGMPIVRRMPDGREVALNIIRGDPRYDARWDSHFGEIMLDNETVPGLRAGDVRWIRHGNDPTDDAFLLTDEQPFLSAAGDYLFGSHWLVTYAIRPLDRGPQFGSFTNKINSTNLSWLIVSQGRCGPCSFSPTHYCALGLREDPGCGRHYAAGFYVCFDQGEVHDRYWTEYGCVVGLPDRLIVRDTTGAIVCLVSGDPTSSPPASAVGAPSMGAAAALAAGGPVAAAQPQRSVGPTAMLAGELRYVFNNGKHILLALEFPHQGTPKVLIAREHWPLFEGLGTDPGRDRAGLWREGDRILAVGRPTYYQGDPAIRVSDPVEIRVERWAR
ncbi:MAG: PQQ-binding-like beta-propeller repeat protein [Kiritimatiellae bacterium]|nr:PQQ-binding-like beta-propeller repeat protein [Kiritimatiellia bacterium]